MLTYLNAFLTGQLETSSTHLVLLGGSILADIAVGIGIIRGAQRKDVPRNYWNGTCVRRHGCWRLFHYFLVIFDKGISNAQLTKIRSLVTELAGYRRPRFLSEEQNERISRAIKPFFSMPFVSITVSEAEPWDLAMDISRALKADGWSWLPCGALGATIQPLDRSIPSECTLILDHIEVRVPPSLDKVAITLAGAIKDANVIGMDDVRPVGDPSATVVEIIVGTKK